MTLREVISQVNWLECEAVLKRLYPEQHESSAEGYEEVLGNLKLMVPKDSEWLICIQQKQDEGWSWWDVSGLQDDTHYSISLEPWAKWIGSEVSTEVINTLSLEEIAIHCLWEMTWHGFDEESVQEVVASLKEAVDEMMDAEADAISFDELKSNLGLD